ncbi:MAG: S46 family peptidase [Candidatus Aminicenantes bacterium]|nr:S46 family peptidase [Candidatus Aminicenantes bacterium]
MKKQVLCLLVCGSFLFFAPAAPRAEEGMWPITEVGKLDLAARGIEVAAGDIFSPEGLSLVNGVVQLSGCTGSFVSPQGLILTNHHCAFGAIREASTKERDYLAAGFLAPSLKEEIPARGYTARITESYRDVSAEILSSVAPGMTPAERTKAVEKKSKEIVADAESRNPGLRAEVAEMFIGRTYLLFLYTYLRDIRLVYAPPQGIGNFGGETDNWMWPRHTGDFSFMRAYVGPDGKPADYSDKNVPYKPRVVLKVATEGVREGDAVMIPGYPGRTFRHMSSHYLAFEQDIRMPYIVDWYGHQIKLMEKMSETDRETALTLSGRIKGLANTMKNYQGKLLGLKRLGLLAKKRAEEADLERFIASNPQRQKKFGGLLTAIAEVYEEQAVSARRELLLSGLRTHIIPLATAHAVYEASVEREKPDLERESAYMDRNFDRTRDRLVRRLKEFHKSTDWFLLYHLCFQAGELPAGLRLEVLDKIFVEGYEQEGVEATLDLLFHRATLLDEKSVRAALAMNPDELRKLDDPFLKLAASLYPEHLRVREEEKKRKGALDRLLPLLLEVKRLYLARNYIPDANRTLRLTFGRIKGYSPRDGVFYKPITSLAGVAEKSTGREPFHTPAGLLELYRQRDFGRFAPEGFESVPVCILYDADTTGGNSGSPVLNGRGELVGVNFDRTFEATINDFAWSRDYSRSIAVDVRYVLWVTQKIGRGERLLKEMGVAF